MPDQRDQRDAADRQAILRLLDDWVFYRDSGRFRELRALFSDDGSVTMNGVTTAADEYVAYAEQSRKAIPLSYHLPGPSFVQLRSDKAVAQTIATLAIRTALGEREVDIAILLKYLDHVVRENNAWKIAHRQPLYIKDRIDPVAPVDRLELDQDLLDRCPAACRYLSYLALANGAPAHTVDPIGLNSPKAAALIASAEAWLMAPQA